MADMIKIDEWLKEFERLHEKNSDEGYTRLELQDLLNIGASRCLKLIKQGVIAGKISLGKRYVEQDWDGRARVYVVYKLAR